MIQIIVQLSNPSVSYGTTCREGHSSALLILCSLCPVKRGQIRSQRGWVTRNKKS
jgi:hypothetical protein